MSEPSQKLLEIMKLAQESILTTVEDIHQGSRSYLLARQGLPALEEKLFIHLLRQEKDVLPLLEISFRDEREKVKTIEFLRFEMKELRVKVLTFGDKYLNNSNSVAPKVFPREFAEIRQLIIGRIQIETEYMFPLIEEYLKRSKA